MAQHTHYWSCSNFADWIRGTAKGGAKTSEGWDEWYETAKTAHPIRYWIAEEMLGHIQDFITWPVRKIYDCKYYINNRWVTRTHALTASPKSIKRGEWCDVGNRFLPCLFNELVDFVEIELAWSNIAWSDEEARAKYNPPFWATGWFRWRTWRCPQSGLDSLEWQRKLTFGEDYPGMVEDDQKDKLTPQAVKAQELLDLYKWWTEVYPNRPDPYEASGWTEYCEASRAANGGKLSWSGHKDNPELRKMNDKAHKALRKIEAAYEKEDEQMMIRLIKVRHGLWT